MQFAGKQRKQVCEPSQTFRWRAMIGMSSVEVPGDGSAAGSAKRESKGVEKESSRSKRQTPKSNGAAQATGPGDQRKTEEKRGRKSSEREKSEKKSGRSRSKTSSSSAAPADETKRADEAAALPSSPSTARSTMVNAQEGYGQKNEKERRRRSGGSRSSASSSTPTARKSSKDGGSNPRECSSQSPSYYLLVEAGAQETTPAPTARAPSSLKTPKPRKRSRSSKAVVNNDTDNYNDNEGEETPRKQQAAVPSGGTDAERAAMPSSSGTASKDARSEAVAAPSYDFPTAVKENTRKECVLEDKQRVTPMADPEADSNELSTGAPTSVTQSRKGVLGTESSCDEAEAKGTVQEGGVRLGREDNRATGNGGGEETSQEILPGMSKRRHRRSTTEERPRRKRGATDPSPSAALGVKVIDEGETKHLVLTASETTAGEGKSGSGSDPSRGGIRPSRSTDRSGSRSRPEQHVDIHSQHQGRSRHFRDNFATAVPTRGGDAVNLTPSPQRSEYPTDAFEKTVVGDEITAPATSRQALPAERLQVEEKQQSEPTDDRHPEHPLVFSRKVEAPACNALPCLASPSNRRPCMAPSFSITTNGSNSNQALEHGSPTPYNKRPSLHHATPLPGTSIPSNNSRGAQSSPISSTSSSSSSPLRGRPVSDRTAKYVTHQASFHADISDDNLDSPLGTARGERGIRGEGPEMGKATSKPPAEESVQYDNAPVVSSSRKTPGMVWETSTQGDRQKGSCGAAPEATGGKTEDLLSSSLPPSAAIPVGSLTREDGNTRLGSNQEAGRDATPSPSQDRLAGGSVQDNDGPTRDLLHFRTDAPRHLLCGGRPELFFLRPNESLALTRIEGSGRLLVTVREEAGAAAVVVVDRAIVHDSAAHFGHAAVQTDHRFPYVAGHRYEFQVESAQGVELAVRGGGDRQATPSSQGSKAENPATGLHVVFSVTSAYTEEARLCHQDAVRSSLPTFEAPPAYNSQQPKEPQQSSSAATASAPSSGAESSFSTQRAPERKPTSAGVRRLPSPSVAEALIAPCVSPPPAGTDNLGAVRATTEASSPMPRAPAPAAAAAEASAGTSSSRMVARVGGGVAEGFAQGGPPQNMATEDQAHVLERKGQLWPGSGVESEQDVRERSSRGRARAGERSPRSFMPASPTLYPYNAPQYRERAPEGATAMTGVDQPSAGGLKWNPAWEQQRLPTLPYIRRHADHTSPRSAFEQHSPSGVAGRFTTRDTSIAGANRFVRPPGYFAHEPPIQRQRQVEASRGGDELHTGYHQPAREQSLYGSPPPYRPGYASNVHSSVATVREHHTPPDTTIAGGESHWGERRDKREQPRASDNRSRWREDSDEGWARNYEQNAYLPTGPAYQPAIGGGHNRGEDPRRYRSDHGGRINNSSSLSDSSRRGYKYGNGLPPSGKESAKMVRAVAAQSDPSRGRSLARGGAAMGRGRREEHRGAELTGHAEYHVSSGGSSERLATDSQARRDVDNVGSRESKERRKRTPQHTHADDPHQPVAYRKSRHGSTGAVHQIGSTAEPVPPRWIKF